MDYDELTEEQIKYTNCEEELTEYMLEEQQKQIEEIKKEQDKNKDYLFLYLLGLIKDYNVSSEGLLELDDNIITDILNKVNKKIDKELLKEKKNETKMIDKIPTLRDDYEKLVNNITIKDMKRVKEAHGKLGGRQYQHYVLSYSKNEYSQELLHPHSYCEKNLRLVLQHPDTEPGLR